jgi:formylmethanofuran dehydrogenase subunit E
MKNIDKIFKKCTECDWGTFDVHDLYLIVSPPKEKQTVINLDTCEEHRLETQASRYGMLCESCVNRHGIVLM